MIFFLPGSHSPESSNPWTRALCVVITTAILAAVLVLAGLTAAFGHDNSQSVDSARFLACIQAVEQTPANPYGLTRETWEHYMTEPYLSTPAAQTICAKAHLRALKAQLRGRLVHAEVWELAVCWLRGFDGGMAVILRETPDPIAEDYAQRVWNLYFDKTFDPPSLATL
jgi:hypothetical protein